MKTVLNPELCPYRQIAAAHELGHAVAWSAVGFAIAEVRVRGAGEGAEGWVSLGKQRITDEKFGRGYLVGLLAGRAAERIYCRLVSHTFHAVGCSHDLARFHRMHRHELVRHIPARDLEVAARELVRVKWKWVRDRVWDLAERGRINV